MRWRIIIEDKHGNVRSIPLDHEYNTEEEAGSEAEDLADLQYTDDDVAWGLLPEENQT